MLLGPGGTGLLSGAPGLPRPTRCSVGSPRGSGAQTVGPLCLWVPFKELLFPRGVLCILSNAALGCPCEVAVSSSRLLLWPQVVAPLRPTVPL